MNEILFLVERQAKSHMHLSRNYPAAQHRIGMLAAILSAVATHHKLSCDDVVLRLFGEN